MKNRLFKSLIYNALSIFGFVFLAQGQSVVEPRFKTYKEGQSFTAIAVDQNKNVWAGTDKQGLFYLNQANATAVFDVLAIGTSPVVSTLRIQSLASDKTGNLWIGHGGINTSNASGGVERVDIATNAVQHYTPDRNARGFTFLERDGLATLNAQQVAIGEDNTVWIAHRHHDLTSSPNYYLTPGAFSFKKSGAEKFTPIGTWKDKDNLNKLIQYPAFTFNPTPSQNPNSRVFNAISVDKLNMWTSVYPYEVYNPDPKERGEYLLSRLLVGDLNGKITKAFTKKEAKFASDLGVFNGVYANNLKGTWATSSMTNEGFSVYKDSTWVNINDPLLIPPGTRFNRASIWGDATGRVYLGTSNGLIVYNGYGGVSNVKSYKLYTKVAYTSPYSVYDTAMLSNNIIAGTTESKENPNFSWIATDTGIMRLFIANDVVVYHVDEKMKPNVDTQNNYLKLAELNSKSPTYSPSDSDKPLFAVDGTTSSIIRYKTTDFDGFYAPNSNYKYEITKNGIPIDVKDTLRYGKLTIKDKNISNYKGNVLEDGSKYVDFIYRHPTYIDANDFVLDKNYTEYELFVSTKNDLGVSKVLFYHPIRFSLPPVLLTHGVWSGVDSLEYIEKALISKGYSKEEIIKCWRPHTVDDDDKKAENPYEKDVPIIRDYILELRKQSLANKVSAGKVNVVAHSRGGLYTRAYIEELIPGKKYYDDINSLITLNTPHFGSQNGNACLDERILIKSFNLTTGIIPIDLLAKGSLSGLNITKVGPLKIKSIFSKSVPIQDRKLNLGAQTLTVELDDLSKFDTKNAFVTKLNSTDYLKNFVKNKVPFHAIATNFDLCSVSNQFCGKNEFTKAFNDSKIVIVSKNFVWPIRLAKAVTFLLDDGVKFSSEFIKENIFNGETNDFIVPNSSMKAGLDDKYVSAFTGVNLSHSRLRITGENFFNKESNNTSFVVGNPLVCDRIFELLKQNFKNEDSNFTFKGIEYKALKYNFLPNFKGFSANKNTASENIDLISKIYIDPNSIKSDLTSGETTTFDVYQENIDLIALTFEYSGIEDVYMMDKNKGLEFKNTFTIEIPKESLGKFNITAQGYYLGKLVAEHVLESSVQVPIGLILQSIKFKQTEVTMPEQNSITFNLLGTYSDGIVRKINDLSGIVYSVEKNTVLQQENTSTLKSINPGQSKFKATLGLLEATLDVTVVKDNLRLNSIVADFFPVIQPDGSTNVKWTSYQEYKTKKFILERSLDNDYFVQIDEQLGQGTNYTSKEYSYSDDNPAKTIYYRLRLLNIDDVEVFNQVIKIDKNALSIGENTLNSRYDIKVVPNPIKELKGELVINTSIQDDDARINIFHINGKLIQSSKCIINGGEQKIPFEMPVGSANGLYLIQLKTNEFSKTVKLILEQ